MPIDGEEIRINPIQFQRSINLELKGIQNRVRNLIGSANWGADGAYKEAILKNVLRKFLPANLDIGTGFIVKNEGRNAIASPQIDIIIYDNTYPLLFSEGDFIIATQKNVRGVIEVKTNLQQNNIRKTIETAITVRNFIDHSAFNGIFSYNNLRNIHESPTFHELLVQCNGVVNHLVLGEHIFIKFWKKGENPHGRECGDKSFYSIYHLEHLSFSYFISNLIESVIQQNLEERFWMLYPIPEGKEHYQIRDICMN